MVKAMKKITSNVRIIMSHITSIHGKPIFYLILNVEKWKAILPKLGIIQDCPISLLLFTTVFGISAKAVGERKKCIGYK